MSRIRWPKTHCSLRVVRMMNLANVPGRAEAATGRAEAETGRAEAETGRAVAATGRAVAATGRALPQLLRLTQLLVQEVTKLQLWVIHILSKILVPRKTFAVTVEFASLAQSPL